MMIPAVLFSDDVRLCEVNVSEDCRIIFFRDAHFARSEMTAKLDAGGFGVAFDHALVHVVGTIADGSTVQVGTKA